MSSAAQTAANQANATHSTGPNTEEGKAASCLNNFHHGLTGRFHFLAHEDEEEFHSLLSGLLHEHQPATPTESILVEKMAQHYWLSQRAQLLQDVSMTEDNAASERHREFALYLRYQNTNDRAFHKCLDQLVKLRAEKRRNQIGFESQACQAAAETRKQEVHGAKLRLICAAAAHQEMRIELRSAGPQHKTSRTPVTESHSSAQQAA